MPRGSEVIQAQKVSCLVFVCFVTCGVAMSLCFPPYALVVLPDRRMRPSIFIQCTHIDQGPILHKALCRVDAVEALRGMRHSLHAHA